MLSRERYEVAVGAVFLLVVIGLLGGLFWAKRYQPESSLMPVQASFPSVGGLREGDAVLVAGLRMGEVEEITLRDRDVLVSMALTRRVHLNDDYRVEIAALNLTGEMGVTIQPGSGRPLPDPTPVLQGTPPFSINSIVGPGIELMRSAQSISETLLVILPTLSARTSATLDRVDSLLALLGTDVRGATGDLSTTLREMRSTMQLANETMGTMNTRLVPTLDRTDSTFASLMATSDTLRLILGSVDTVNSTAAKLLRDSTLHEDARRAVIHLDSAAVNLDSLIRDINRNPKRYISISIF